MKNINKILGVILTLAILAGSLMMAIPVSAGTNSWSVQGQPIVTAGTNANVYAIAADGTTIYLYDGAKLQKSTDAGLTWSNTGLDTGTGTFLHGKPITKLVVSQSNAGYLAATDGVELYRSSNSGQTWSTYTPVAGLTILSIDIAASANADQAYLVGTTTGVYLYETEQGLWVDLGTGARSWVGGDRALAVEFSPNYAGDTAILAVANTVGASIKLRTLLTYGDATAVGVVWNAPSEVKDVLVVSTSNIANFASLAVPSNYDPNSTSYNKVFVGLGSAGAGPVGVYRANAKTTAATTATSLDTGINVSSLAFKGTASAGTLAVGQYNSVDILSSASVTSGDTPDWFNSADTLSSPTGGANPMAVVQFSPTAAILYAGTAGASSSLFSSTDYRSFAGIAFQNVSALANVTMGSLKVSGNYMFAFVTDSVGPVYMLFASSDAGLTWKMIRNNGNIKMNNINLAKYADDKTVYLAQDGAVDGKKILKTNDGGATWTKITSPGPVVVSAIAVVDANTYWAGSSANGVQLSTSSAKAAIDGEKPAVMISAPPFNFFFVSTFEGSIYMSTDLGVTFNRLGDSGLFKNGSGNAPPKFVVDAANKTVYSVNSTTGDLVKWVVGTSTAWETVVAKSDTPINTAIASSIQMSGGVWYMLYQGNAGGQIWRSTDLKDTTTPSGFSVVTNSDPVAFNGTTSGNINVVTDAAGNANLYILNTRTTFPIDEFAVTLVNYQDTLLNAPKANSPTADSVQNNTQVTALGTSTLVDLSWNAVSSAKLYEYQIANDADFKNIVSAPIATAASSASQISLVPGRTYYWRVRVSSPILSKWSAGNKFTTATTSSTSQGIDEPGRIYPAQGSVITGNTITFTWGSVPTADAYEVVISKNGIEVDRKTGLTTTVYTYSKLETGAQYTWTVRAISGGLPGNWVTSAFTTSVPPATTGPAVNQPTPNVTVNVPPITVPQATVNVTVPAGGTTTPPKTPAYIWVIIVIGAVLVIAVVVLIVRTRRV